MRILPKFRGNSAWWWAGIAALLITVPAPGLAGDGPDLASPLGVKLEVLSVRRMDVIEARRRSPPDVFGLDLVVRLRLSCNAKPISLAVSKSPGVQLRFGSPSGGEQATSPGLADAAVGLPYEWIVMPGHSAIEWELLDAGGSGPERRAYTVFIADTKTARVREIVSTTITVPAYDAERRP